MKVSIIVPIFNEAPSLSELFDELCSDCVDIQPFELICIDDGSTDETLEVLTLEKQKHPEIRIIKFKSNAESVWRIQKSLLTSFFEEISR